MVKHQFEYFLEKLDGPVIAYLLAIVDAFLRQHANPKEDNKNKSGNPDVKMAGK